LFSSDFDYSSLIVQGRVRLQVGWAQALHLRARWGRELGGDLPVQKQFVAGGLGTVRGYNYQSLYSPSGEPVPYGGRELALLNAEYVLGIHNDLSVGLFADSGMVWENAGDLDLGELESSVGVGLILAEPGDNSLRLDFIQPLESGGRFLVQGRLTRPF
jgi:translocation and assembly module TamA